MNVIMACLPVRVVHPHNPASTTNRQPCFFDAFGSIPYICPCVLTERDASVPTCAQLPSSSVLTTLLALHSGYQLHPINLTEAFAALQYMI